MFWCILINLQQIFVFLSSSCSIKSRAVLSHLPISCAKFMTWKNKKLNYQRNSDKWNASVCFMCAVITANNTNAIALLLLGISFFVSSNFAFTLMLPINNKWFCCWIKRAGNIEDKILPPQFPVSCCLWCLIKLLVPPVLFLCYMENFLEIKKNHKTAIN